MINIIVIEKVILATILYDYSILKDLKINKNHFSIESYQEIFIAIKDLYKNGYPIDEEFINKVTKQKYQNELLEILSTNVISNFKFYELELIEAAKKRELSKLLNNSKELINDLTADEITQKLEKSISTNFELNLNNNIIKIAKVQDIEAKKPSFYLEDILPIQKNEINLFSSKGGVGKSWILLYILSQLELVEDLKCFGWFSEDSIHHTKHRLNILSLINSKINDCDFSLTDDMPKHFIEYDKNRNLKESNFFFQFKKAMKDYDIICLDPLIAFFGADENSNTEARFFMNLLNNWCKEENKTILLIHHHNKSDSNNIRGASAFVDAARLHYTVNKIEDNTNSRLLKLEKTNHYNGKNEFKINLFEKIIIEERVIDNFENLPVRDWDDNDIEEDLSGYWKEKKGYSDEW